MTRRLTVVWPDPRPFAARDGAPIRLLAVSDAPDPALDHAVNRDALGTIDAIVGCGDLEPGYLGFLADAFRVPVEYVRGNHDRGGQWTELAAEAPKPLASGHLVRARRHHGRAIRMARARPRTGPTRRDARLAGRRASVRAAVRAPRARHDVTACWSSAMRRRAGWGTAIRTRTTSASAPTAGCSSASDRRSGSTATRRPPASPTGVDAFGSSVVANVTGSVIVELVPPPASPVSSR